MRSNREHRYASYPDIDVAAQHAIIVRKAIERANGRNYTDLQCEAEYDLFFDFWFRQPEGFWHKHFPNDIRGTSADFESWFESCLTHNGKPMTFEFLFGTTCTAFEIVFGTTYCTAHG